MPIGPEAQKAARIARESQGVIAEPSLTDDDNYRAYLKEAIADIQKVVAETHVGARKGEELSNKLEAFAETVKEEMERLATPGATHANDILSIIPAHKESLKEDVLEALRVHLIGYFRANEKNLSGSIFETPLSEEQKRARSHYVQEFIANFGAHLFAAEKLGWHMRVGDWPAFFQRVADGQASKKDLTWSEGKAIRRLATRKMADFSREFFYGSYVHNTLQAASISLTLNDEQYLFSDLFKRKLCVWSLGSLDNAIIATGKVWLALGDPEFVAKHAGLLPEGCLSPSLRRRIAQDFPNTADQGLRRLGENYRLFDDSDRLRGELEMRGGIRVTRGIEKIRRFMNHAGVLLEDNPCLQLVKWLRGDLSLGSSDYLRSEIIFEDLWRDRKDTQE